MTDQCVSTLGTERFGDFDSIESAFDAVDQTILGLTNQDLNKAFIEAAGLCL